jgi:hypothetical protein
VALLVAMCAGVASQQAANDPSPGSAGERFTPLLSPPLDMYAAYFSPHRPHDWTPWP